MSKSIMKNQIKKLFVCDRLRLAAKVHAYKRAACQSLVDVRQSTLYIKDMRVFMPIQTFECKNFLLGAGWIVGERHTYIKR